MSILPADWPALRDAARARGWCLAYTLEHGVLAWPLDARGFGAGMSQRVGDMAAARAWVAAGCEDEMSDATATNLRAPFPWAGGKREIAAEVWARLGNPPNYVEPCFGSGAVLLARPGGAGKTETVNDKDGLLANVWRAIAANPEQVAHYADWPVNENDLHARHVWLLGQRDSMAARLEGNPEWYDAKAAGWWVWGACAWIGSGWCSGDGPWRPVDGRLVNTAAGATARRKLPHLGDAGMGISRKLPHLGNAGMGINRQLPHLGDAGRGALYDYMAALSARLRRVRVACGEWDRVLGESVTTRHGLTGVFLDPPYADDEHAWDYTGGGGVFAACRAWAIANGDNPLLRIALCGYGFEMPAGWAAYRWKARGGYGSQGNGRGRENAGREVVWFSPHCLNETPLERLLREQAA